MIAIQKPAEVNKIANPIPLEENFGSPSNPIPKRDISCDRIITKPARKSIPPKARIAILRFDGHRKKIPDDRLRSSIEVEISGFLSNLSDVNVKFFPKKAFTDRQLLAGEWAPMSNGQRSRRVRWLITMTHVAIGKRRESSAEPNTWSLFDRRAAHNRFKQIEEQLSSTGRASVSELDVNS